MSLRRDINRMHPSAWKWKLGDMIANGFDANIHPKGSFWYVDAANGNDSGNGKDIDHAVQTIQQALYNISLERTASGKVYEDVILLMPTNAVDYDDDTVGNTAKGGLANAYVRVNLPNITIMGVGPLGSVVINPGAAATAGVISVGASATRFRLCNVVINTATAQSAAIKFEATGPTFPVIENCIFDLVGAAGPLGVGIDMDAGKISYPVIRNCTFYLGTLILAGIIVEVQDATPYGGLIENCDFLSVLNGGGTGIVDVINVKDGTGLIIRDCNIHGGDTGTNYNAADGIDLDSGVLNTLIASCNISGCDALITDGGTDTDIVRCITADGEGSEYANAEEIIPAGLT